MIRRSTLVALTCAATVLMLLAILVSAWGRLLLEFQLAGEARPIRITSGAVGRDRHRLPCREWYPRGKTVIQLDARGEHIGRRTHVDLSLVGDAGSTLRALLPRLSTKSSDKHVAKTREKYVEWLDRQKALADPAFDRKGFGVIRRHFDNTSHAIRPELVAAVVDRYAANDAIFTGKADRV